MKAVRAGTVDIEQVKLPSGYHYRVKVYDATCLEVMWAALLSQRELNCLEEVINKINEEGGE